MNEKSPVPADAPLSPLEREKLAHVATARELQRCQTRILELEVAQLAELEKSIKVGIRARLDAEAKAADEAAAEAVRKAREGQVAVENSSPPQEPAGGAGAGPDGSGPMPGTPSA